MADDLMLMRRGYPRGMRRRRPGAGRELLSSWLALMAKPRDGGHNGSRSNRGKCDQYISAISRKCRLAINLARVKRKSKAAYEEWRIDLRCMRAKQRQIFRLTTWPAGSRHLANLQGRRSGKSSAESSASAPSTASLKLISRRACRIAPRIDVNTEAMAKRLLKITRRESINPSIARSCVRRAAVIDRDIA